VSASWARLSNADSEAERNVEHLERGEIGPGVPEK
jgi:hypothetical protein